MIKLHTKNAGYDIVSYITIDDCDIVLGHNPKTKMWVTWEYTEIGKYHWGHYFSTEINAKENFAERILNIIRFKKDQTPWE